MKELWKRVLLPVSIPVIALAVIVFAVLNFSRVLIAVEESNSPGLATMLACILGGLLLGACVYFASREAERRKHNVGGVLALGGVTLLVCGLWGYQAVEVRADAEARHAAENEVGEPVAVVHAFDIGFREKTLALPPGPTVIGYENEGAAPHTFVIEGVSGKLEVGSAGATDKAEFELTPGEFAYFCDVPGHRGAGMEGKLTVAEGAGGGGGGGEGGGAEQVVTVGDSLAFDPATIEAPASPVKITLKATSSLPHSLVVEGVPTFKKLEVAAEGASQTGTLTADPGEYVFFCDLPGHRAAGMQGTIKIGGA